jgi:hypothetical protein
MMYLEYTSVDKRVWTNFYSTEKPPPAMLALLQGQKALGTAKYIARLKEKRHGCGSMWLIKAEIPATDLIDAAVKDGFTEVHVRKAEGESETRRYVTSVHTFEEGPPLEEDSTPPTPPQEKSRLRRIFLTSSEMTVPAIYFSSWRDAYNVTRTIFAKHVFLAGERGSYNKTRFRVEWENGTVYNGARMDIGDNALRCWDLGSHLRTYMEHYSGRIRPEYMSDDEYDRFMSFTSQEEREEMKWILDNCEIIEFPHLDTDTSMNHWVAESLAGKRGAPTFFPINANPFYLEYMDDDSTLNFEQVCTLLIKKDTQLADLLVTLDEHWDDDEYLAKVGDLRRDHTQLKEVYDAVSSGRVRKQPEAEKEPVPEYTITTPGGDVMKHHKPDEVEAEPEPQEDLFTITSHHPEPEPSPEPEPKPDDGTPAAWRQWDLEMLGPPKTFRRAVKACCDIVVLQYALTVPDIARRPKRVEDVERRIRKLEKEAKK